MGIIDNRDSNTVVAALKSALKTAKAIDIHTGYFFFSGFYELAEEMKDIKVRITVGMDIDPKAIAARRISDDSSLYRFMLNNPPATDTAKIRNYHDSFVALFNNSSILDKDRITGALDIFIEKIKDGSLEVKMNLESDHAKYYLVHNRDELAQDGANPGTRLMGSSNFTISGLKLQKEIVDRKIDPEDFNQYLKRFNEDWETAKSVSVLDKHNIDDFLKKVESETSMYEKPSPYIVYLRILKELFDRSRDSSVKQPGELSEGAYKDFEYQKDAVIDALSIIEKYNGVIIADVVGLGKSIIASAVAANLANRTIIITPPHLRQQWENYAQDFDLKEQIYTSGKIEKALEDSKRRGVKTIIVDEAHRYRNEDTDAYQALHKLCLNNKVVLLTATPFNNDPRDLFALIRLFDAPSQSRINTVDNLSMEFRRLITEYQKIRRNLKKMEDYEIKIRAREIAQEMRQMSYPVIIRRSRVDLDSVDRYKKDLESQGYEFPKMNDPVLLEYGLGELEELYRETLEEITDIEKGFSAARYQPVKYIKDAKKFNSYMQDHYDDPEELKQAQVNLANFMRRLLVMRFESSIAAFDKTLGNFIKGHEIILAWYKKFECIPVYNKGSIPDPEVIENTLSYEEIDEELEDVLEQILVSPKLTKDKQRGLIIIPSHLLNEEFIEELKRDIDLLSSIKSKWKTKTQGLTIDPKAMGIKAKVDELLKANEARKIVIFTAYTDTADHLEKNLIEHGLRVFKYTGAIASAQNQRVVKENFDAGLRDEDQKGDFDVLVATDAISEGYNLHRAGVIINYDIPYNPVRVVQRVGRINRVNKRVFNELFIFNCFPTFIGEDEVATKRISGLKIHLMHELMGTDTRILTDEESIQTFFVDRFREANEINNEESWDAEYINYWDTVKYDKRLMTQVDSIKQRTFLGRNNDTKGIILFGKRGKGLPVFVTNTGDEGAIRTPAMQVLRILKAQIEEKALDISNNFEPLLNEAFAKLFQPDKLPKKDGRRGKAIDTLDALREHYPKARYHCEDAKKIIKDLDGFPEGLLKKIIDLQKQHFKNQDFEGAYAELQKIASEDYMIKLQDRIQGRLDEPESLLIAEELF